MKVIKILNTIAVGTPFVFLLVDVGMALLSTMFTGFVQVILGFFLMIKFPKNRYYQIYIAAVIVYFALWFIGSGLNLKDGFAYFLFSIPPCLAVYLSVLIYSRPNNEF